MIIRIWEPQHDHFISKSVLYNEDCTILNINLNCLCFQAVSETLTVGASLLLPPLAERMEILHSLLPQSPGCWYALTKGQVGQDKNWAPPLRK